MGSEQQEVANDAKWHLTIIGLHRGVGYEDRECSIGLGFMHVTQMSSS